MKEQVEIMYLIISGLIIANIVAIRVIIDLKKEINKINKRLKDYGKHLCN